MPFWAGQAAPLVRDLPASELVEKLVAEAQSIIVAREPARRISALSTRHRQRPAHLRRLRDDHAQPSSTPPRPRPMVAKRGGIAGRAALGPVPSNPSPARGLHLDRCPGHAAVGRPQDDRPRAGGEIPGFSRQNREFRRFSPRNRRLAAKTVKQIKPLPANSRSCGTGNLSRSNKKLRPGQGARGVIWTA